MVFHQRSFAHAKAKPNDIGVLAQRLQVLTHSLTHSLTYLLTHSLTHSTVRYFPCSNSHRPAISYATSHCVASEEERVLWVRCIPQRNYILPHSHIPRHAEFGGLQFIRVIIYRSTAHELRHVIEIYHESILNTEPEPEHAVIKVVHGDTADLPYQRMISSASEWVMRRVTWYFEISIVPHDTRSAFLLTSRAIVRGMPEEEDEHIREQPFRLSYLNEHVANLYSGHPLDCCILNVLRDARSS